MSIGILALTVLALFGIWVLIQRFGISSTIGLDVVRAADDAPNPGSRRVASRFEEQGFRPLAVYSASLRGVGFTVTVMPDPAGESWAEVTDRLWEVVSCFGSRRLRTTSQCLVPGAATTLVQCLPGAAPSAIVEGHRRALALLAGRGMAPDRLTDEGIVDRFESDTRAQIEFLRRAPWRAAIEVGWRQLLARQRGRPALAGDHRADHRIRTWLHASPSP